MGVLGWSPDQFWSATLGELTAASDGWRISQGDDMVDAKPFDQKRLDELKARYPD